MTPETEKCPDCGFRYQAVAPGDYVCTDFCCVARPEDIARWKAGLQDGEFAVWPCSKCGIAIEDEWSPGALCSSCFDSEQTRKYKELLQECQKAEGLSEDLRSRISSVLK